MGIVELATIFGTVFGGASTGLVFFTRYQEARKYESLAKELTRIEEYEPNEKEVSNLHFMAERESEGHYKEVVKWLKYADLIIEPVRSKISRRLMASLVVFVGGLVVIPLDLPNLVIPEPLVPKNLEVIDIPWLILMLINFVFYSKRFIATPEEILFLQNMESLQDAYYKRFVSKAMAKFNIHCKYYFSNEIAERGAMIEEMQADLMMLKDQINDLRRD